MIYILGSIALIIVIYGLILFLRRGNREFGSKLPLKERTELEKMIERKVQEKVEEEKKAKEVKTNRIEEIFPKAKPVYPTKNIENEITRYATHIDLNNFKVQHSIRNGVENFLKSDYKVALEEFSLAIELNPADSPGYYCRGLTKLQLKNFESAISDFTEALSLKHKEPNSFYYRALAYFYMQDIDNAILNLKSYINIENNSAEAYYDLAMCYKQKEKFEEAINNFSFAIEKEPKYELAYFERGLLKHKMGDKEGGCTDLRKALEMGYLEAYDYVSELCRNRK